MPAATHMARRRRRNSARMISTKAKPPPAVVFRTLKRSTNSLEVSVQMATLKPSGRRVRTSSR